MNASPSTSEPLSADVLAAIQRGNKIEAIKILRITRGLDLKEAKDIVDNVVKSDPLLSRKYQQQAASGRGIFWVVIIGVLLILFYLFL